MTRKIHWIFILALGAASAAPVASPYTMSVCDVLQNAKALRGREIVVRGVVVRSYRGSYIKDDRCRHIVHLDDDHIRAKDREAYDRAVGPSLKSLSDSVVVTLRGRLNMLSLFDDGMNAVLHGPVLIATAAYDIRIYHEAPSLKTRKKHQRG
jgi:hypothetical protein